MPRTAPTRTTQTSRTTATPRTPRVVRPPNIIEAMNDPHLFGPFFDGASWDGWKTILKAANGLPLAADELEFFHSVAGDRSPPSGRVRELWVGAGRRAGKDAMASGVAALAAALFIQQHKLRPGERALVLCLACDRAQAKIILNYVKAFFTDIPSLAAMVQGDMTAEGFSLNNKVDIAVGTNSFVKAGAIIPH
jgi:hypothetical protein